MAEPQDKLAFGGQHEPGQPMMLRSVSGPAPLRFRLVGDRQVTLGRAATCDFRLPDDSVSKRHAALVPFPGGWTVQDLGSRHGTFVNGRQLASGEAVPIAEDDLLVIRPWTFAVTRSTPQMLATLAAERPGERIESLSEGETVTAREQYQLLLEAASAMHAAETQQQLIGEVLARAQLGSGMENLAVLRVAAEADQLEVMAWRGAAQHGSFSTSLIKAAARGHTARLLRSDIVPGVSIMQLGIVAAVCAPIMVAGAPWGYLYLDSRSKIGRAEDPAAFIGALADLAAAALTRLKAAELDRRLRDVQHDLSAALEVQRLIMPRESGQVARCRYRLVSQPGRLVSGDLFDIMALPDGRAAMILGDVEGKGVGAAFLMAVAQTMLRTLLLGGASAEEAMLALSDRMMSLPGRIRMVTLWLGIFDAAGETVSFCDAGHGYAVLARDRDVKPLTGEAGVPLGVVEHPAYPTTERPWPRGSRVVVFSDGLVEQVGPQGSFGLARVMQTLAGSKGPEDDISLLMSALAGFAGTRAYMDDVTIVSVQAGSDGA